MAACAFHGCLCSGKNASHPTSLWASWLLWWESHINSVMLIANINGGHVYVLFDNHGTLCCLVTFPLSESLSSVMYSHDRSDHLFFSFSVFKNFDLLLYTCMSVEKVKAVSYTSGIIWVGRKCSCIFLTLILCCFFFALFFAAFAVVCRWGLESFTSLLRLS